MTEARELIGTGASAGIAVGPAAVVAEIGGTYPTGIESAVEHASLAEAMRVSAAALTTLAAQSDADSAAILDFQIELLMDPALLEATAGRIDLGDGAALAWAGTLDGYITQFEHADDAVMRSRAVDIIDIKNRVLCALAGRPVDGFPRGAVFVGKDVEPSRFLAHDWSAGGGIVLSGGSTASHVALLARARAVPMVVGVAGPLPADGERLFVDGAAGRVVVDPPANLGVPSLPAAAVPPDHAEARTADGVRIGLSINVNDPAELATIDPADSDGIGLMRTEFLMASPSDAFNEDRQYGLYRQALAWAAGRPVTIRMLDLGGDKPLAGLGMSGAGNFLGLRGIRLLLARPEIARAQARALLRAAVHGDLRVLLPMVTVPTEVGAMAGIFREEAAHLARRGIAHARPPIGMMVEVPAAALMLDTFAEAAFFSLGTNDLAQYLAAAARDNPAVAPLYAAADPAVLRLIATAAGLAAAMGRPLGICGDMAGDVASTGPLLAAGLRHFSVVPARLGAVRSAVSQRYEDGSTAMRQSDGA